MKCVIAGSREIGLKISNGRKVQMTLEECPWVEVAFTSCAWVDKITEIVSGTALGVDTLGEELAKKRGLELAKFPADWKSLGKKAGHLRNKDMALYCDIAIVIMKQGGSAGSLNMIENMRKLKKPCLVFELSLTGELNAKQY